MFTYLLLILKIDQSIPNMKHDQGRQAGPLKQDRLSFCGILTMYGQ